MTFIRLCAAVAILLTTALPAAAAQLSLSEISAYLNTLTSAKGQFTQINSDGTISTGTIYLSRPGKVRFEYNPPEQALVIASSGQVVIFDQKLSGQPESYPLSQTPLSIILARNVNLGRAGMVTGQSYDGTATTVVAQDPDRTEYGSIELKFTGNPVELRQWIIKDGNGGSTTVILQGLEKANVRSGLFNIQGEMSRQKR